MKGKWKPEAPVRAYVSGLSCYPCFRLHTKELHSTLDTLRLQLPRVAVSPCLPFPRSGAQSFDTRNSAFETPVSLHPPLPLSHSPALKAGPTFQIFLYPLIA